MLKEGLFIVFTMISLSIYAKSDENYMTFQLTSGVSASSSSYDIGYINTLDNSSISIHGGGYSAFNFSVGKVFKRNFEFLGSVGFVTDGPDLNNGSIKYFITVFQSSIKYNIIKSVKHKLYFGGGLAYYSRPKLYIDASKIQGGDKIEYFYNSSISPLLCVSYHYRISKVLDFLFDINSSFNKFDLKNAKLNDTNIDTQNLSNQKKPILKIDGSNLKFLIGLAINF